MGFLYDLRSVFSGWNANCPLECANEIGVVVKAAGKGSVGNASALSQHFFGFGNALSCDIFGYGRAAVSVEQARELCGGNKGVFCYVLK